MSNVRKRMYDFPDNDEEDPIIKPVKKVKTTKPRYDVDLSSDADGKKIPPYTINCGKGIMMEVKEYRGSFYIGLSRCAEGSSEIKNRFNIPIAQLETLEKACVLMLNYIKDYFESLTRKVSTVLPCPSQSYTSVTERHEAISYSIIVTDVDDNIIFHEYFSGENVIKEFLNTLNEISKKLLKKMHQTAGMIENINSSYDPDKCHICKKKFLSNEIRVRDHCHWGMGYIRGLAHQSCNLNYRATYFIPVIIHNSRNYDSHLILKNLTPDVIRAINIIPVNMEKFTMFSLDALKFLDSFQFLDASLDTLVNNLKSSNHKFKIFNSFYKNEKNRHLLKRKGVFPYSYVDEFAKLKETNLPPKEAFFNVLTNSPISESEYKHAKLVFKTFECKNLADYLELYQNVDTIMLSECFNSLRRTAMKYYQLDPVFFLTMSELTWNAGLKLTKVELQLLSDVNEYIWFESQMRGGISFLGTRYATANNPYIPETYNPYERQNYILALDANNLYGYAMSLPLPIGHFSWLTNDEVLNFNIFDYDVNSNVGFILEADLLIPKSIHNRTSDLPLAIFSESAFLDLRDSFSDIMDCSNFPPGHILHNLKNKGKLGYLKSETIKPIKEFIGLKPKMYAFSFGETCKKTGKGVKKSTLQNFTMNTYKEVLESESSLKHKQALIISKKHELTTVTQNKTTLSAYYDKKYLNDDGITSLAYGHYLIEK
ncbi:uncharacterized protein LOC129233892 [Uloborus diversus]|uniref:uncharacterized protein LOC129233892 n=1 Tax=Uloborus diversus TaxID=327109 RepID=UPI002409991F|nr:uncharacterized protein LOC129233892 [Uloborus diversus]